MRNDLRLPASFRDPSGFVFKREGVLYRQVNQVYREAYERLMSSGLYEELVGAGLLVSHLEVSLEPAEPGQAFKVIRPESVPFISYPYEWSFSQLQDAALATLAIQKRALKHGMSLKDASAYNIQFHGGRPVLIDSLSFETYTEGQPWVSYRQFCQHFLAPLALMALRDVRLSQLLRVYIDGLPLDLASILLPRRTRLNFGLATHLHLHAAAQKRYAGRSVSQAGVKGSMSRTAFLGLIDSLEGVISKLAWNPAGTEWAGYYEETNYSSEALEHKRQVVAYFLDRACPKTVWDLGANTGLFSRLASGQGISTVAFDIDPAAVELNYQTVRAEKEAHLLPLLIDLTNPSPGAGWQNQERASLVERGPVDAIMALALVHHLAISNNVPLSQIAAFFQSLGHWLFVELAPKSDTQVQRLLASRQDIFPEYTPEGFEKAFAAAFSIVEKTPVRGSERILYLMESRAG